MEEVLSLLSWSDALGQMDMVVGFMGRGKDNTTASSSKQVDRMEEYYKEKEKKQKTNPHLVNGMAELIARGGV